MIGKLLCRVLGHREQDRFTITMADEVIYLGCMRCGGSQIDKLAGRDKGDER